MPADHWQPCKMANASSSQPAAWQNIVMIFFTSDLIPLARIMESILSINATISVTRHCSTRVLYVGIDHWFHQTPTIQFRCINMGCACLQAWLQQLQLSNCQCLETDNLLAHLTSTSPNGSLKRANNECKAMTHTFQF